MSRLRQELRCKLLICEAARIGLKAAATELPTGSSRVEDRGQKGASRRGPA